VRLLRACRRALAAGLVLAPAVVLAQEAPPAVPDAWRYGRRSDGSALRFCVDPRDGAWQVQRQIGEAIAGALLLEPEIRVMTNTLAIQEIEDVYATLLADCDIYLGFKLLPQAYPGWLTLTRPIYEASYAVVSASADWRSLGDMPPGLAIGPTLGIAPDLRLVRYLMALPADRRWRRFPMGSTGEALSALVAGTVGAAIVWEPEFWALARSDPAIARLHVIASDPLPPSTEGVGGALLARQTFLRAQVDQAIAALIEDGTIGAILAAADFPGRAVP
jgi:polar amino acid transport system substrate-binding protein